MYYISASLIKDLFPHLIMFSSNTTYKGEVGRGRKGREREGECRRESTEAPPRSLRVFLVFFQPVLHSHSRSAEIQRWRAKILTGKKKKGGKGNRFASSLRKERDTNKEKKVEIECLFCTSVLPSARAQLCTTVFPDGEDAGRGRGGPPGATKPADWQGEGDDPGLLGKSLPELWWRWGGHTSQVFLFLSFILLCNQS